LIWNELLVTFSYLLLLVVAFLNYEKQEMVYTDEFMAIHLDTTRKVKHLANRRTSNHAS